MLQFCRQRGKSPESGLNHPKGWDVGEELGIKGQASLGQPLTLPPTPSQAPLALQCAGQGGPEDASLPP